MSNQKIVSQSEWLVARKQLLQKEREFTHQRDALSKERRNLPMVKLDKEYVFDSPRGKVALADLFDSHNQLIVYHFMFDPEWEEGCRGCSHVMDNIAGSIVHLAARNTALVAISRADLKKIEGFKKRMGWNFPWYSSTKSDFNYDFHVTLDPDRHSSEYNYQCASTLLEAGKIHTSTGELPGLSVFLKDGKNIYHTYSTYQRGLDLFLATYNLLDHTPLGRQEEGEHPQSWLRHHDRY